MIDSGSGGFTAAKGLCTHIAFQCRELTLHLRHGKRIGGEVGRVWCNRGTDGALGWRVWGGGWLWRTWSVRLTVRRLDVGLDRSDHIFRLCNDVLEPGAVVEGPRAKEEDWGWSRGANGGVRSAYAVAQLLQASARGKAQKKRDGGAAHRFVTGVTQMGHIWRRSSVNMIHRRQNSWLQGVRMGSFSTSMLSKKLGVEVQGRKGRARRALPHRRSLS